ncbi:MAG: hypothetical protein GF393_06110 [Armatimonadia bacterium]|nr:hypothetical protein [Armatimonadia bacterium]
MNKVCVVLALIFVLSLVLSGCGGGDGLPYVGDVDDGDQTGDGGVTPTPPGNGGTPTPPPPPGDGDTDGDLQPPAPPVF